MSNLLQSCLQFFQNWSQQLSETFIEDSRYMWLVDGLKNTLVITLGALLIGVVLGGIIAIIKYFAEDCKPLRFFGKLCDIYVIPYLGEKQISSGTLIYTMAAAKPIISTPFWYAKEMLANERGLLFDFKNADQLAERINELLDDETKRKTIA